MENEALVCKLKKHWDNDLAMELFRQNLGFCAIYVKKYCFNCCDAEDYFQLAYIALINAVREYDSNSGYNFLTYYKTYLNSEFYRFNHKVQFPFSCSFQDYRKLITKEKTVSYDRFLRVNSIDTSIAENTIVEVETWEYLRRVLTPVNYKVMFDYFVRGKTMAAIGRELGIGKERVRQRKLRILKKLSTDAFFKSLID